MGKFMTEKEMESYLKEETRIIPFLGGQKSLFRAFRLFWLEYDFLTICAGYTGQELVDMASTNQEEVGSSFEQNFLSVVAYANQIARKKSGID